MVSDGARAHAHAQANVHTHKCAPFLAGLLLNGPPGEMSMGPDGE